MFAIYLYDHLTGSWAQSLWCLLPIFDPDGVGQNPSDFFPLRRARFKDDMMHRHIDVLEYTFNGCLYLHSFGTLNRCQCNNNINSINTLNKLFNLSK
jgi:hypothetical protein